MPEYTVFASIQSRVAYRVEASNAEEAVELVREDFELMDKDIIEEEIDDLTVEY